MRLSHVLALINIKFSILKMLLVKVRSTFQNLFFHYPDKLRLLPQDLNNSVRVVGALLHFQLRHPENSKSLLTTAGRKTPQHD